MSPEPVDAPLPLPLPLVVEPTGGPPFRLTGSTAVMTSDDPSAQAVGRRLVDLLVAAGGPRCGLVPLGPSVPADGVVLRLVDGADATAFDDVPAHVRHEAFALAAGAERVEVTAVDVAGLRHGVTVLAQLAQADEGGALRLPALTVRDHPRFAWRGLSLDVARSFAPVATVLTVLDVMASLRLNTLHLHLTDDQGWRLETPSRPELSERSGVTAVDGGVTGFYTVDDYAQVVRHAASLGITVVPEVDVPGHVHAAIHALPALDPEGLPAEPYTGTEVGFSRLRVASPATVPFLDDVFADLAAMTPGPYLHMGGDEPLSLDTDEYVELVGLAAGAIERTGKRVVAWQEAARAALTPGSVVQYWHEGHDVDAVLAAAAAGAQVLLSPASRAYLDMKYDATTSLGLDWAGHITLADAYGWEPLDVLPGLEPARVVGVEAAVWTETIRSEDDLFSMLLPRLAAIAEVAWTPPYRRDLASFLQRLAPHRELWSARGVACGDAGAS